MGTNYIAPTWRMPENTNKDKLSNYSIDTDGTGVGINCGSMADLFGTASVTYNTSYSIWIKPEFNYNDTAYQTFFGNYTSGSAGVLLYYHSGEDKWRFLVGDGSGFNYIESTVITSNEELGKGNWQHHCVVFDRVNSNAYYYINGTQVNTSTSVAKSIDTNANFYIGKKWDLTSGTFNGEVGQACIFDYTLSTDQRTYLYNLNNPMTISGAEPIAYWPLGDNANLTATAGYPNISVGADSVFNFSSDRIDLGLESNLGLGGTSKYSTSLWFKKSINGSECLWGYNYGDANGSGYYFWLNSGALRIAVGKDGETTGFGFFEIAAVDLPIDTWQNIVVVFDGTLAAGDDRIKVYQNGEVATGTYTNGTNFPATLPTGNGASNRNVYLGQLQLGNGSFSYNFSGEMSNVMQWTTDLSLSDANTIYNNGTPLSTASVQFSNLKAWYKLNQSANWEADTVGEWQIPDAVSSYPQSFNFVSTDGDRVIIENGGMGTGPVNGINGAMTASIWVNTKAGLVYEYPFSRDQIGGTNRDWNLVKDNFYGNGGRMIFGVFNTSNVSLSIRLTGSTDPQGNPLITMNDGKWHNIVGVYNGTDTVELYTDGVLQGTNTSVGHGAINATTRTGIGGYNNGSSPSSGGGSWNGGLSNAQIWNTNLSSAQIQTLYNNGSPLTTAIASDNLKGWYKFDDTDKFNTVSTEWNVFNNVTTEPSPNYITALSKTGYGANYLTCKSTTLPFSTDDVITSSFWMKTSYTGGNFGISSGVIGVGPFCYISGQLGIFRGANNYRYFGADTGFVNDGNWHHILLYSPGYAQTDINSVRLFIDGIEYSIGGAGYTAAPPAYEVNYFGGYIGSSGYLNGTGTLISSNAAVWNSDQTSNINEIYNNGTPPTSYSNNPSVWWTLTDIVTTTGGGWHDSSGNGNNSGGVTYDPTIVDSDVVAREYSGSLGMTEQNLVNNNVSTLNGESSGMNTTNLVPSNISRTQPFSSYSVDLDGTADYFNTGYSLTGSDLTLSYWVKADGIYPTFTWHAPATTRASNNTINQSLGAFYRVSTNLYPALQGFDSTDANYSTYTARSLGDFGALGWKHILWTYDNTTKHCYLYVDGVQQSFTIWGGTSASTDYVIQASTITMSELWIGANYLGANAFDGKVSNVAMWNSILNSDDIINIYNNGVPQNLSNFRISPTVWYPMDQSYTYFNGSVLVARDVIGANDATGLNVIQENIVGDAPGSGANGTGTNLTIADLKGDMKNSINNSYSINMADYADGVTNPANSGRSTNVP